MFNAKVRLLLILFMLFGSILIYPTSAWGCSCEEPPAPQEAFVRADAVFVGTVMRADDGSVSAPYTQFLQFYQQFVPPLPSMRQSGTNGRPISFDVENSWRGVKTTHFTVRTGWDDGDCGYAFEEGKQYLVYAYEWGDGLLHADICSRTAALTSATEDLDHLQTIPKLELTYVPPISNLNPLMLYLGLFSLSVIGLCIMIWRWRDRRKPIP